MGMRTSQVTMNEIPLEEMFTKIKLALQIPDVVIYRPCGAQMREDYSYEDFLRDGALVGGLASPPSFD